MYGLDYEMEMYKDMWFFERWFYEYDHSARSMMRSSAVMGYGVPTRGIYCLGHKGYKTFGSVGQGPIPRGVKDVLLDECQDRGMLVTITSIGDHKKNQSLKFEFGSWTFDMSWEDIQYKWETLYGESGSMLLSAGAAVASTSLAALTLF